MAQGAVEFINLSGNEENILHVGANRYVLNEGHEPIDTGNSIINQYSDLQTGQFVAVNTYTYSSCMKEITLLNGLTGIEGARGVLPVIDCRPNILVLPWVGKDLYNYIIETGGLQEKLAIHLLVEIARHVEWLYNACGITHNDLKPENVLIDPITFETFLIDLNEVGPKTHNDGRNMTPYYTAPEENPSADAGLVYSLGLIFYYMTNGDYSVATHPRDREYDKGSPTVKYILKKMLDINPKRRPGLISIANLDTPSPYLGIEFFQTYNNDDDDDIVIVSDSDDDVAIISDSDDEVAIISDSDDEFA